jgi:hypothetical protein
MKSSNLMLILSHRYIERKSRYFPYAIRASGEVNGAMPVWYEIDYLPSVLNLDSNSCLYLLIDWPTTQRAFWVIRYEDCENIALGDLQTYVAGVVR